MTPELMRRLMSLEQYTTAFLNELRACIASEQEEAKKRGNHAKGVNSNGVSADNP